jgi:hypothetical protein
VRTLTVERAERGLNGVQSAVFHRFQATLGEASHLNLTKLTDGCQTKKSDFRRLVEEVQNRPLNSLYYIKVNTFIVSPQLINSFFL